MRYIVLLRHGDYSAAHLNEKGEKQVRATLEKFVEKFSGRSVTVVSSPLPRAVESARIMTDGLSMPPARTDARLHETSGLHEFTCAVMEFSEESEILILVSHRPVLTKYFKKAVDGWNAIPEDFFHFPGDALILDPEESKWSLL